MKIAIVGSREWPYKHLGIIYDFIMRLPDDAEVVSGRARGVDSFAESAAQRRGLQVTVFRADWQHFGHSAGFRRNVEMVQYADQVAAFWDGQSRGTAHSIRLAKRQRKPLIIFYPDGTSERFNLYGSEDK